MAAPNIDCSALARVVYELAEYHARNSGVDNVDSLTELLAADNPTLDREQVTNAIAEASMASKTARKRAISNIAKLKREAKTDVQLRATIDDLENHLKEGELPADKPRRPAPVDPVAIRRLKDQVQRLNAAVENAGKVEHLAEGTLPTPSKPSVQTDPQMIELIEQRDLLTQELRNSPAAQKIRDARTVKQLQSSIAELQTYLAEGTLPPDAKPAKPRTQEIVDLREKREAVRRALANSEAGITKRLKKQITEMLDELQTADFAAPVETKDLPVTAELQRTIDERDRLRRKINQKIADAKPRTAFGTFAEASAAHRFLRAGFDFSAVGVQNIFNTLSHPVMTYRSMIEGYNSMRSEENAARAMEEIQNRANAPWYSVGKVRLSDLGGDLAMGEEGMMTGMLRRMPEAVQGKFANLGYLPAQIGRAGHAMGRGGTVFLNKMRADLFDLYANSFVDGRLTPQRAQAIGSLVNNFTGAGGLGRLEKIAPETAAILFSARNFASQIAREITIPARLVTAEVLNVGGVDHNVLGGRELSRAVTKHYGRFLAGVTTLYASAIAAGWEVEKDPQKSSYGNITMPGTNISFNPLGGMRTLYVLIRKTVTGKRKTSAGEEVTVRGPKSARGDDFDSNMVQFLRGKEAPLVGAAHDWIAGKDNRGREVTAYSAIGSNLVPMSPQDMFEAIQDAGIPKGMAASVLIHLGIPTQIYDATEADTKSRR